MLKNIRLLLAVLALALPCAARADGDAITGRTYLSIDYSAHGTFRGAVGNSFAPTDYRANVGAVLKNTIQPLNPVRYVGAVAIVELQKQIASGNGIDPAKILKKLDPAGLAGGYFGAQIGETLGAVAQTALSRSLGPMGGTVGFALRPILWLVGSSMGGEAARSIVHGDGGNPIKTGIATALREFNPVQDSIQMIGDNVGGVIGQALIPVPFVGMMAGACVGGVAGLLLGKAICATGPGGMLNDTLKKSMNEKANDLVPERAQELGPPGAAPDHPPAVVPVIHGATSPRAAPAAPVSTAAVPDARTRADIQKSYLALQEAMRGNDPKLLQKRLEEYRRAKEGR